MLAHEHLVDVETLTDAIEDERAATEKARRSGEKFPAQVLIFDQFNK